MTLHPGSDQYPGVSPLNAVLPLGALPAENAFLCGELFCVGMGRVTLLCQYAKVEHEQEYLGTGVVLTLELSPYALDAQVPAGESEWWPVSVIEPEVVAGCTVNDQTVEHSQVTYCGVSLDDTLEAFTLDFSLPTHAQRLRVCARELDESEGHGEGQFGCYALLSLDPGGEFGWTLKTPSNAIAVVGAVEVEQATAADLNATVTGTIEVEQADAADLNATVVIVEKEPTALSGTEDSAGATAVVASPGAGNRIVVTMYQLQNEVATEQTAQLHEEGDATAGVRCFMPADNAGFGTRAEIPAGHAWKLAEDTDLVLTLANATAVGWSIRYYTEAV